LNGCIEVGYKTEVKIAIGKKKPTPKPTIVDNGYPTSIPVVNEIPAKRSNSILARLSAKKRATDAKAKSISQRRQRQQKNKPKSKSFFARFIN